MEWVNEHLNDGLIDEEERNNFEAFGKVLTTTDIVENHGGRYLLIRNGKVWGETFASPQDTCSEEFDEKYVLFRVPKEGYNDSPSIFGSYLSVKTESPSVVQKVFNSVTALLKHVEGSEGHEKRNR